MQVTILLSAALLGDKLNMVKLAAASLMVSGVVLVCKPPFVFNPSQTQVDITEPTLHFCDSKTPDRRPALCTGWA